ncbi:MULTISPECIES: hypothetical protein [unclassified Chamaesiphon]|uniref:hypothetical protein n=1 Tax=unclassified Chamaesiphon TaxID=2620921 RepID=UPI00286A3801|nr:MULTISPECIES: hypothetical protein [unclassified Chamaesiphon]
MTTSLDRHVIATAQRGKVATDKTKGQQFAAALKAKYDGTRPLIEDVIFATVELADLQAGKSYLEISHHPNRDSVGVGEASALAEASRNENRKPYYTTKITNKSTQRIRIDRFGTYVQKGHTLVLHSLTGGFLSAQQFQEWYELGASEWLEPGQVVTDPNNHSNLGVYWAYSGTTADGKKFVAGAAWVGKRWWKFW